MQENRNLLFPEILFFLHMNNNNFLKKCFNEKKKKTIVKRVWALLDEIKNIKK